MSRAAQLGVAALLAGLYLPDWAALLGHFPAHMLRHMGLVAAVAPLAVLAWPGAARRWRLPVVPSAGLEFAVVWAWHLPALHLLAQQGGAARLLEQAMFLAAGWLVWSSALTADEPMAGAGGLFLTSVHMTMLGALLVLAPAPLYPAAALAGQQLGGMLMLAIGTPVYLFGGLALVRQGLRRGLT